MLASGLYVSSQSASASRPHIVKKPPTDSPKTVDITQCSLLALGVRLADKIMDSIRRMVPPTNLHELRSALGVFVQSSRFIPNYAYIIQPLTHLMRSSNGKPVPFIWTVDQQQQAYHKIRNLLLDCIHLCPANYILPFHCGSDADNDGKALASTNTPTCPPAPPMTVTTHSASETTVLLTDTNTAHTIPHNDHTRRVIA
jgi:hypothetical protein